MRDNAAICESAACAPSAGLHKIALTFDPRHPICRGDYPVLIFSGSAECLADLAGEPTAASHLKFAMADRRFPTGRDFARAFAGLPQWNPHDLRPIDGACFVFSDSEHPAIASPTLARATRGKHWVTADEIRMGSEPDARFQMLINSVPAIGEILILGYGQQGMRIASMLLESGIEASRIIVHDSSVDSAVRVREHGFSCLSKARIPGSIAMVIYSPLSHYPKLHELKITAERMGVTCFDNSMCPSQAKKFHRVGKHWLDNAARHALEMVGDSVRLRNVEFALPCTIIRHEIRRFNGVEVVHLQSGEMHLLCHQSQEISLAGQSPCSVLHDASFVQAVCAFIGISKSASHGFFAARELAKSLWPTAAVEVFRAEHEVDLGSTSFERMLRNHLDCREIVPTMQTPAQRVILGIAARRYAAERPIIEIGSALGGSALLMASATEGSAALIYSIDPDSATRDIMRFAFQREGQIHRLRQIVATSEDALPLVDHLRGNAGLVFIDGLHTEQGVRFDFEHYASMVAPGGALIFHDAVSQIATVLRVVLADVLRDPRFKAVCLVDGLMVLERRAE